MSSSYSRVVSALGDKFARARKSGALFFFDSTVKDVEQNGRKYQIRVCPALQDKAKATKEAAAKVKQDTGADAPTQKKSPFEPPYIEDLHVGDIEGPEGEEGMAVLLNKYAVLPEHFLVVTKTQQPQSLPPTPAELLITYNLLLTASEHDEDPRRCFAFYNGGAGAGASQSWRHLQVIEVPKRGGAPVESWVQKLQTQSKDKPFAHPDLPYLHLIHHLPAASDVEYPPTEESNERMMDALAKALMSLLDVMFTALHRGGGRRDGGWNLLMTLNHLHLIPRSHPDFPIKLPDGSDSKLEVNALGYAGMLLAKSDDELQAMLDLDGPGEAQGIARILQHCGVPREWADEPEQDEGELAKRDRDVTSQ